MNTTNGPTETVNWCLSGGADNSDLAWGEAATHAGHTVTHFSFAGHRTQAPADQVVQLSAETLAAADPYCARANLTLQRRYPPKSMRTQNLLRRNWYQVETASACYAISTLKDGLVAGGTGWAVELYLDKNKRLPCDAFVFDQVVCRWYRWDGHWEPIYQPPKPCGIWAGIGTQELTFVGRLAINVLLDYWPVRKKLSE